MANETTSYQLNGKTINKSTTENSWRLVYNVDKAFSLFESSGVTETPYTLECYTTEQECLDRCIELNLDTSSVIEEIIEDPIFEDPIFEEYTPFEEIIEPII